MCKSLNISSNAYYSWKRRLDIERSSITIELKESIQAVYAENRGLYGAPKLQKALERKGVFYSRSYISRLMKEMGLYSKTRRKFTNTTDSNHSHRVEENHLDRNFEVLELGKVWVSDITYIKVNQTWQYLTTMIDLADRKVVGWSVSSNLTATDTVITAWKHARLNRNIEDDFILHSDRGVQYTCDDFKQIINLNTKAKQSMSRKGNCWDNAVAESFFKTIKTELCYLITFESKKHLETEIFKYMNWYNNSRLHSTLDYKTPTEKEQELRYKQIKRVA